jgi:hypothetical protein
MGSIRASAVAVHKQREQCRFTLATSTARDRCSNPYPPDNQSIEQRGHPLTGPATTGKRTVQVFMVTLADTASIRAEPEAGRPLAKSAFLWCLVLIGHNDSLQTDH